MDLQSHLVERYAKALVDLSEEEKAKFIAVLHKLGVFVSTKDQAGVKRMLEALLEIMSG